MFEINEFGTGRPLLLLHGGGGPFTTALLAQHLAEIAHVIAPTHPGFNGTPRDESITTVRSLVDAYAQYLIERDLHEVIVVGLGEWSRHSVLGRGMLTSVSDELDLFEDPDPEIEAVAALLTSVDPTGARWASVIRHTYDMIYNGQETGRYKWSQLMKTEKTHFGTLFEINAQREFNFDGGDATDYRIAGIEVDAKWSQLDGGWMLPPEVFGRIALVATGDDAKSTWSVGLVRVNDAYRREGGNRDKKSQLNARGRAAIRWLWRNAALPPNILLQLPPEVVEYIFDHRDGTIRTNRLFKAAEGRVVHRNSVATVSRQLDD